MHRQNLRDILSFDIDAGSASGQAIVVVIANHQVKLLTVEIDGNGSSSGTLYKHSESASIVPIMKEWIAGKTGLVSHAGKIKDQYHVVPNWKWRESRKKLSEWRSFWDSWIEEGECDFWPVWRKFYRNPENKNKCDLKLWEDFWSERENWGQKNCLIARVDSWRERGLLLNCDCWISLKHEVDWDDWRDYWTKKHRKKSNKCWESWINWEIWTDFWRDRKNWKDCNNWEEWKACWKQYLIERKVENITQMVEEWLMGDWELPSTDDGGKAK